MLVEEEKTQSILEDLQVESILIDSHSCVQSAKGQSGAAASIRKMVSVFVSLSLSLFFVCNVCDHLKLCAPRVFIIKICFIAFCYL